MNGRFAAFLPSVEADLGQEVFLPADPWTLLKSGKIADVPVMAGVTADETAFFVQSNCRDVVVTVVMHVCERYVSDTETFVFSDAR